MTRSRQFGLEAQTRQRIGGAVWRDAAQVIVDHLRILILADDEMAIGGDGQIVAIIEFRFRGGFKEELKPLCCVAEREPKDLAQPPRAPDVQQK